MSVLPMQKLLYSSRAFAFLSCISPNSLDTSTPMNTPIK